ncbi:hypothetical protein [Roseospira navarrensis]|uniref:ACT domain-containing protein n=1 Tax=Roseospira navarrensis TaxID=140058 RepID=A0A7X2D2F7_9PROT|nr:hypothetical protein [Roseospira navarrensis]MQX36249.1 hypothetical protein [Roseospira navarrensis]
MFDTAAVLDRDPAPTFDTPSHPGRLRCRIEGARDPNLLSRIVGELCRRSCVPEHLESAPVPGDPEAQWVTLSVTLSGAQEAAHLAARFASWPVVRTVQRLEG